MTPTAPELSIVIPAYNEERRLPETLRRIRAYLDTRRISAEIIVVDDGSSDGTAALVERLRAEFSGLRLVLNDTNRGKGYSVRHGMLEARGDVLLFTDADLSSPIAEAAKLFAALEAGADVALGSRWLRSELQTERQPVYRQLFGRLFNLFLRVVLGLRFRDTQCGFKAFTRRAAQAIFPRQRIERWGFDAELLFLAVRLGFQAAEVPVQWAHDERSKMSYFRDGMRMVTEVLRIRWYSLAGRYEQAAAPAES